MRVQVAKKRGNWKRRSERPPSSLVPQSFEETKRERQREREEAMAEEGSVEERLLLACQSGDAHTVQRLMSEVPGLDVGMATEGGVTLLMHAIIGAG